jgi:hypothetical protein
MTLKFFRNLKLNFRRRLENGKETNNNNINLSIIFTIELTFTKKKKF